MADEKKPIALKVPQAYAAQCEPGSAVVEANKTSFSSVLRSNPVALSPLLIRNAGALRAQLEKWCKNAADETRAAREQLGILLATKLEDERLSFELLRRRMPQLMSLGLWRGEASASSEAIASWVESDLTALVNALSADLTALRSDVMDGLRRQYALGVSDDEPTLGRESMKELLLLRHAYADSVIASIEASNLNSSANLAGVVQDLRGALSDHIEAYATTRQEFFAKLNPMFLPEERATTAAPEFMSARPVTPGDENVAAHHDQTATMPPPANDAGSQTFSVSKPGAGDAVDPPSSAIATPAKPSRSESLQKLIDHTITLVRTGLLKDIVAATRDAMLANWCGSRAQSVRDAAADLQQALDEVCAGSQDVRAFYFETAFAEGRESAFDPWLPLSTSREAP